MNSFFLLARAACYPTLFGLLLFTSCTLRETRQEGSPGRGPEFKVRAVEQASLNGLDVLPLRAPADMDLVRRNQLIAGYVNKQLPLRMRLLLNAYNPNLESIAVTGLDYTVFVDGKMLGAGRQETTLNLPAGDSVRLPLTFEFNTYKFLGDDALPALRNFALGFSDLRRQRVTLRVRPLPRSPRGRLSRATNLSGPIVATQPATASTLSEQQATQPEKRR